MEKIREQENCRCVGAAVQILPARYLFEYGRLACHARPPCDLLSAFSLLRVMMLDPAGPHTYIINIINLIRFKDRLRAQKPRHDFGQREQVSAVGTKR